jgi:membrane-associated phospholipid phosphatase
MRSPLRTRQASQLAERLTSGRSAALRRRWGLVPAWLVVLAAIILIATTIDIHQRGAFYSFDHTVSRWMVDLDLRHRRWPKRLIYLLTLPGQRGTVLIFTIPTVAYLTWRARSIAPLARYVLALVAMTVAVYLLKDYVDRPAPTAPAGTTGGASYPSGHVANAVLVWGIVWWTARELDPGALLTRVLNVVRLVGPVLVAIGMTLLNYHWISDYVGGATIAVILLAAVTVPELQRWCIPIDRRIWRVGEPAR